MNINEECKLYCLRAMYSNEFEPLISELTEYNTRDVHLYCTLMAYRGLREIVSKNKLIYSARK